MKQFFKKSLSAAIAAVMMICALLGSAVPNMAASRLPGDVNRDGVTDNKDVTALFRYLSGNSGGSVIDVIACDTNGDAKTNNKDVTILFRHLNDESIAISYGVPVPDNVFILDDDVAKNAFITSKQTTVSLSGGGVCLSYNKPSSQIDPYVTFSIAKYVKNAGKPELPGKNGAYIAIKAKATTDGYMEVFTHSPAAGDRSYATYKADGQFHYFIVDMTKTTMTSPEKLSTVRLDWAGTATENGATMIISEIGFFEDLDSALAYTKLNKSDVIKEHQEVLNVPQDKAASDFFTSTSATVSDGSDNGVKTAVIKSAKKSPNVFAELRPLAEENGKRVKKNRYIAIRLKLNDQPTLKTTLKIVSDVSGTIKTVAQDASPDCTKDGWQGVLFDIRDIALYEEELSRLRLDFTDFNTKGSVEIGGITVTDDLNKALTFCEHSEYCINVDENLTDNDELANTVLTAENEDSTVKLWFDQSTQKTERDNTESTGRTGYTVRMAKNESENCQFFVAPEKTLKARVEIENFTNVSGDTVPFEAFFEYYHNINNTMIPDAIPPLTEAVEIAGGNSQGFVIQLTTAADTPAGTYNSVIHVYDDNTGKEIKRAAVAVKVWNFELSEKTELRTAFALWGKYVLDSYNWNNVDFTDVEVMDNYFEFFLKYRINIMDNPHGLTSGYANRYMSQDRVNTARWSNLDMSIEEDNDGITPVWKNKVIYYPGELDEPRSNDQFAMMKDRTERIKANTPDYRMVVPFERNLDLTDDGVITTFENAATDQVGYMSRYVNIWCPKLDAFTTRDLGFISRTSFLQSEQQDAKYGTFLDRMKKEVDEGDELWAYVCINPTEPYANWQLLSDGTETIVSIWQMKDQDVTGMLYWAVNLWKVSYWNQDAPWTGTAYGDGFLIYSGYKYGLPTPISSLRLENIRDGIEDYQMLCMLEDALGEEAADEMIHRITTSVVTFATNDDYIHAVRVLLGDTLEAALAD